MTRGLLERKFGSRSLWSYLYRSILVLVHQPAAEEVTTEAFILKTNDCQSCSQPMRGDLLEVGVALRREINNAIERVSLSRDPLSHDVCDVQGYMLIRGTRFRYLRVFL